MSEWIRWGLFVFLIIFLIYYLKWNKKQMPKIWYKMDMEERTNKIKKIKKKING